MKRFAALFLGLAVILTASAAFAVVQDFGEYTVDVIEGWTAVPKGDTVYFVKNDNSASWSVMFGNLPGSVTIEQYAKDMQKQTKGSNFRTNGKGTCEFEFKNSDGRKIHAIFSSLGGNRFMQWGITGEETAGAEITRLIDSMTPKKSGGVIKRLDTKYFTVALPNGWDGYELDETSVMINKDDDTASMYVEIEDLEDWEPEELAEFYANEHNAKDLKYEDGSYSFTYEEDGKINVATFGAGGGVYMLLIQTAEDKAGFEALAKLRGAINRK